MSGAPYRVIYKSRNGRVLLLQLRGAYSVEIAGAVYGPYCWRDALAMYSRHKGAQS